MRRLLSPQRLIILSCGMIMIGILSLLLWQMLSVLLPTWAGWFVHRESSGATQSADIDTSAADLPASQLSLFCGLRQTLNPLPAEDVITRVVRTVSSATDLPEALIRRYVLDPSLPCTPAALKALKAKQAQSSSAPASTFTVGKDGFPLTGNRIFDLCFRASYGKNTLTPKDIRTNLPKDADVFTDSKTRKHKAMPVDCASYHPNNKHVWTHPDGYTFTYNTQSKTYSLPEPIRLVKEKQPQTL